MPTSPELPDAIPCEECSLLVGDEKGPVSRVYVNELHWGHRPMHPNEVGGAHRRQARKNWDAWLAASPYGPKAAS